MQVAARDYELVCRNLAFLRENWREQPSLETLAERNGISAAHMQRLFMRWAEDSRDSSSGRPRRDSVTTRRSSAPMGSATSCETASTPCISE